jgi:putative oxidoreductase
MVFRSLARPLLASWFVYGAVESVLEPELRAARSAPVVEPLLKESGLDVSLTDLVKIHGVATIAAASVLALSRTPRTAGVVLTGLAAISAAAGRPFWLLEEGPARDAERERFFINLSLLGGAMLAATAGHSAGHKKRANKRRAKAKARRQSAKNSA